MSALVAVAVAAVSVVLAVVLARVFLGGLLALMLRPVRTLVQRVRERRRVARAGADRRKRG